MYYIREIWFPRVLSNDTFVVNIDDLFIKHSPDIFVFFLSVSPNPPNHIIYDVDSI